MPKNRPLIPRARPAAATRSDHRRLARLLIVLLSAALGALLLIAPQSAPAHADAVAGGGDYLPLDSTARVLDTRNAIGAPDAPLAGGDETAFTVLGVGGIPTTNITAVLLDVSMHEPTLASRLKLWADGTPQPSLQGIVQSDSRTEPLGNTAVVPVGENGKIRIWLSAGTADAVVDVHGYFTKVTTAGSTGGGFVPVDQTRIVDTRNDVNTTGGAIPAGGSRTVTLGTAAGVPTNTTTLFASVVVFSPTVDGFLRILPGTATTGTTGPDVSFPASTYSSGTTLRLSGGKATIVNRSTGPVQVAIDVEGYFSPNPNLGSGFRPADGRVLDTRTMSTRLAGRDSLDFQVGGANGLPVKGVTAALLNIHSVKTAQTSNALVAWPTGSATPSMSVNYNPGNPLTTGSYSRVSLNIIKTGTDGKITIKNQATTEIDVYIELEGWFAGPLDPVTIEPNSRTAITQATPATSGGPRALEFAYTNNAGQLVHAHIPDPDNSDPNPGPIGDPSSTTFTTLSGGEAFTGTPALGEQADGKLVVAGHHTESNVWSKTETLKTSPPAWPDTWTKVGGSITSHPALTALPDGKLVQFGIDSDGALWQIEQSTANGAWAAWHKLGDPNLDPDSTPTVVTDPTGALQLFARTQAGSIRTATYTSGGALSTWTDLAHPGTPLDDTGTPAVAVSPTLMRVFVRTPTGGIATKQQNAGGTWPAAWQTIPGATTTGPPTATLHPTNGTFQVVARSTDNRLLWTSETTRNSGTWTSWGTYGSNLTTDPNAFSWTASTDHWGVIYRIGNDVNQIADFTDTDPPPLATPAKSGKSAEPITPEGTDPEATTPDENLTPQLYTFTRPE